MKIRLEPLNILKCGIWLADKILLIQAVEPLLENQRLISEIPFLSLVEDFFFPSRGKPVRLTALVKDSSFLLDFGLQSAFTSSCKHERKC